MSNVPGIDTIQNIADRTLPMSVHLTQASTILADSLRQAWNRKGIAFIPYCVYCKKPLVWHLPAGEDNVLFHCPQCGRKWLRDQNWIERRLGDKVPTSCDLEATSD